MPSTQTSSALPPVRPIMQLKLNCGQQLIVRSIYPSATFTGKCWTCILLCVRITHFECCLDSCIVTETITQNSIIERKRREKSIESYLLLYLFSNYSFHILYSYNPDLNSDPYGEDGCLWSYNLLFSTRRNSNGSCFSLIGRSGILYDVFSSLKHII